MHGSDDLIEIGGERDDVLPFKRGHEHRARSSDDTDRSPVAVEHPCVKAIDEVAALREEVGEFL